MRISNECDALLCVLYREYRTRRSHGVPIRQASYFRDDTSIRNNFMPLWLEDDVSEVCWRLVNHGLLFATPGDDKANNVTLTEEGIIYMEDRFDGQLERLLSRLAQLTTLVAPWVG